MLHAWSMSVVLSQKTLPYKSRYAMVPLGLLLTPSGEEVKIDDRENYKQLTVKTNGGGIVERNAMKKSGKDIKTRKQTKVKAGEFLFSKIDARNGAFGIVPRELDGTVVTAEFPVFSIKEHLVIPQFLWLLMVSKEMSRYIKSLSQGSTNRKRLDIETFLGLHVPLPSIDEQKAMMTEYDDAQERVRKIEREQEQLPGKIQKTVFTKTGTEIIRQHTTKRLQTARFKNMDTWSVDSVLESLKIHSTYPMVRIGDCIQSFMKEENGKTLRVSPRKNPEEDFLYIGMEVIEKNIGRMNGFEQKKGSEIKSGVIAVPKGYVIYGKLRPNLNKYWVNTSDELNVVCSTEFFVFSLRPDIDTDYFECLLGSDIVQEQIKKHITGTGLPRINVNDFQRVMIPNPPASLRRQLGSYFKSRQKILWEGRDQITFERERAKKKIESQIFE